MLLPMRTFAFLFCSMSLFACSSSKEFRANLPSGSSVESGAVVLAQGVEIGRVQSTTLAGKQIVSVFKVEGDHKLSVESGICALVTNQKLTLHFDEKYKSENDIIPACKNESDTSIAGKVNQMIKSAFDVADQAKKRALGDESAHSIGKKLGEDMRKFGEGFGEGIGDFEKAGQKVGKSSADFAKGVDKGIRESELEK